MILLTHLLFIHLFNYLFIYLFIFYIILFIMHKYSTVKKVIRIVQIVSQYYKVIV